jgi:hypothetical protein
MAAPKGNQNNLKHGGAAAMERLRDGQPFAGLAREEELNVQAQLSITGSSALVTENAVRLQTATNLYWNAVCAATESGDLQALDRYIARYGWLASCALRAWAQVNTENKRANRTDITTILQGISNDKTD